MKNLDVYLILLGILLMFISGFLFLFMNNWQVAEGIVFLIGFFLIINAEKIKKIFFRK
ncbi:hypothetical protein IGI39_004897 [Enterococcus sp. AZ135]|uniref:hypothetical protein n=1 Tax=unclassified Enterococcus TaxID=2608891 RepID=UPI003F1FE4D6